MHGWHLEFRCQSFDCLSTRAVARGARQFARAVKDTRQHTSRTRGSTRHRHAAPHVKDTRQHTPKTRGNTRQRHAAAHVKDTRQHTGAKMWHATRKTCGTRERAQEGRKEAKTPATRRAPHLPPHAWLRHLPPSRPLTSGPAPTSQLVYARVKEAGSTHCVSKKRAADTVCQTSAQHTQPRVRERQR